MFSEFGVAGRLGSATSRDAGALITILDRPISKPDIARSPGGATTLALDMDGA